MALPDAERIVADLERAGRRAVLVATGGGSPALSHLLTTPGASAAIVEALVPYAREAIDRLLGGPQESYCSSRTARRLAVAAWQRARSLGAAPEAAVGAAVTAALRSRQPKRGPHRVIVALQTLTATRIAEVELDKAARSRADEEQLAAALLLEAVGAACGGGAALDAALLRPGEEVRRDGVDAPAAWRDLFAGTSAVTAAADDPAARPRPGGLVFPGSFDPFHEGHRLMARIAEEVAERPLDYELSIENVDKPALDYLEIRDRAAQFTDRRLWLTRAATFLEKLVVFPESTFVMGADTYVRLADPRYYGGSEQAAAEAARTIAERSRGLVVFGRVREGVFHEVTQLDVPRVLRDVTYFVSEREFRSDVSSTELRRRSAAAREGACG
jgi:nicotinic acid mononucleotide adenylyltransferase/nicotinamide mononucleotide (NMN) deamidase PncC